MRNVMRAFNQRTTPDGRRVVDLLSASGEVIRSAPVQCALGLPLNVPLEGEVDISQYSYMPAVVVVAGASRQKPIVIGVLESPKLMYAAGNAEEAASNSGLDDDRDVDDMLDSVYLEETVIPGPKGSIAFRQSGKTVLSGETVSVQLPAGGYVRVSEDGDTTGRLPLVDPLSAYLQTLVDKINTLQRAVDALQAALVVVPIDPATSPLAIPGIPPTPFPLTGSISILRSPVFFDTPAQGIDEAAVSAATLRISNRTEG
jgi:hypothetical protein